MTLGLSPRFPGLSFHTDQERGSVLVIQAPGGSESVSKHGLLQQGCPRASGPTWAPRADAGGPEVTRMPRPCVLLSLTYALVFQLFRPLETLARTRPESVAAYKSSTLLLRIFQSIFNSFGRKRFLLSQPSHFTGH